MLSIQEVKKQTGVTVRTLRYYDQIGLLLPADKTQGGHRLYGEKEMIKLQEIQFLKSLGFSLSEIKEMLSDERDWKECLQGQLAYVINEKLKLEQIEQILQGLLNSMAIDGKIDLLEVQRLIQLYTKDPQSRETYRNQIFNKSEMELLKLLPNVNRADPDTLEWVSLLAQLKKHMHKGEGAPQVQQIIRRMFEKQEEAFGDNDEFLDKLWNVRKSPEKSKKAGFYPIEPEVLDFLEGASDIYLRNIKKGKGDSG
ncbi:MerR family transcriptional regulator [Siminovitchia fortis]|uniref:MerR family transcriptional regulator n=1 Tax=Siminovitchia fortis TaxID=254758 RepID=A0A443ILY8_9BACI|nr:MerR family transcriptional regulator [Siminovitchia fortis]RWR06509.1 MerR family transcriptional regulator [Siminovitchia fortis]WHY80864.1 MerR family transcriptional regulator [Siminovitchia fortis]